MQKKNEGKKERLHLWSREQEKQVKSLELLPSWECFLVFGKMFWKHCNFYHDQIPFIIRASFFMCHVCSVSVKEMTFMHLILWRISNNLTFYFLTIFCSLNCYSSPIAISKQKV